MLLSDRLRGLTEPYDIMCAAAEMLAQHLAISRVRYMLVAADGESSQVAAAYVDGRLPSPGEGHQFRLGDAAPGWIALLRSGEPIVSPDVTRDSRGLLARDAELSGARAAIAIPLLRDGRLVAILSSGHPEPRHWTDGDLLLHREVAERTLAAVERARAEAALRASEQKYRSLFEAMDEGFALCELVRGENGRAVNWRLLEINAEFEAQSGLRREQVTGRLQSEIGLIDPALVQRYQRVVDANEIVRFEYLSTQSRCYDVTAFPCGGDRFALISEHISARKRAEHAARESAARQAFLLALSDAVRPLLEPTAIQDTATRLLAEHLGVARAYYAECNEEAGISTIHRDYARDAPSMRGVYRLADFAPVLHALRRGRAFVTSDWRARDDLRADVQARLASQNVRAQLTVPLFKGGKLLGTLTANDTAPRKWTALDVSIVEETAERTWAAVERANAVAALKVREAQLAFLDEISEAAARAVSQDEIMNGIAARIGAHLRLSQCAFLDVDAVNGRVITGFSWQAHGPPRVQGRTYRIVDYLTPEFERAARAGEAVIVRDTETDPRTDARAYARLDMRAFVTVPFHRDGAWKFLLAVGDNRARDWSVAEVDLLRQLSERLFPRIERTRAEHELREAHEAEVRLREAANEANRAKDEFLALLGHELRNPLTPILATIDLMRMQDNKVFLNERAIIERQARHLARLVDDLLDVTRIARGKVKLVRTPIEIGRLIARAVETVSPMLEEKGHRLTTAIEPGLLVEGDADRLVQVVSNLLANAAKYTQVKGSIAVSAGAADGGVVVQVRDNGSGIPGALLPHVFDLFRQGPQASDRAQGGLGLGLAIVRNIVDLHGGRVAASSGGPRKGSTFTVWLPRADQLRPTSPKPLRRRSTASARVNGRRILVVDDNRDSTEVLALLLTRRGYQVEVAHDAVAGIKGALAFRPSIALLDIGLPEMDGYQLARRLKAKRALRDLRLIAVTGYGQPSDRAKALEAGFSEHVTKPFEFERLAALIEEREPATPTLSTPPPRRPAKTRRGRLARSVRAR